MNKKYEMKEVSTRCIGCIFLYRVKSNLEAKKERAREREKKEAKYRSRATTSISIFSIISVEMASGNSLMRQQRYYFS